VKCEFTRRLIDAYMDSELDSPNAIEVEAHLAECDKCRQILEARQELSKAIKLAAGYVQAPAGLRTQIRRETHIKRRFRFGPVTTGIAFAVGVVLVLAFWRPWPSEQDRIIGDVLSQHETSVSTGHLVDVASADPKIIQAWFSNKLGYSPSVPALNKEGFELVGGRLGLVQGHSVPVVVYAHKQRKIDIFITPSGESSATDADREGIHVRSWNDCGVDYRAVSNDTPSDLSNLHKEFLIHK